MAGSVELIGFRDDSDHESLRHLIVRICPQNTEEPAQAYEAFCDLALTESNITDLGIEQGFDLETVQSWAEEFHWNERIKECKSIFQAYKRKQWQAREEAILKHWNDRREKFLEVADQLLAKADLLLKHPHVEKVIYKEVMAAYKGQIIETQIVISPVKWQTGDVATLQKTALALLQEIVGDREIMIDRLTADGYVVTNPEADDIDIEGFVLALERLEELERGF